MLTDEKIHEIAGPMDYFDRLTFARAIEAALAQLQKVAA
jgi:hypothetical protein